MIQSVDTARQYIGIIAVDSTDLRLDSDGFYVGDSIYWDTLEAGEVTDTVILQSQVYYRYYVGTWQRYLDGVYYGGLTNGPIRCDDRDPSLYVVQAAEGRLSENELPLR